MTQRKPPGVTWETWIDRQIRVGMEHGAFDDLPGHGRPVPDLDGPRDEMWWVRDKVRRENVSHVPPTVQVRRELDAAVAAIVAAPSEVDVRAIVAGINQRVRWVNSRPTDGPPSTVAPLDAEAEVAAWRAARRGGADHAHGLDETGRAGASCGGDPAARAPAPPDGRGRVETHGRPRRRLRPWRRWAGRAARPPRT